jgi:hypothetical protein
MTLSLPGSFFLRLDKNYGNPYIFRVVVEKMKTWIGGLLHAILSKAGNEAGNLVLYHIRNLADLFGHEVD